MTDFPTTTTTPLLILQLRRKETAQSAETVFVGDSVPRDMAGARGIGMRHVWLKAPDSNGAAQPCCPGDPVIRRLAELEEIVP